MWSLAGASLRTMTRTVSVSSVGIGGVADPEVVAAHCLAGAQVERCETLEMPSIAASDPGPFPCKRVTLGVLHRRRVIVGRIDLIGKESNGLERAGGRQAHSGGR